jgi:phosphinothricin acetyltransferase
MEKEDYPYVKEIYLEGIHSGIATFQTSAPCFEEWDQGHMKACRFVITDENNRIYGWVALSMVSSRCVYRGVAEVSVYIAKAAHGKGLGSQLLQKVTLESEKQGIWTLQAGIFEMNTASIALHKKCGFRLVGVRERIAQDCKGTWQNTVLMEKRSTVIS